MWGIYIPPQFRTEDTFVDEISNCLKKLRRVRVVINNKLNLRQNSLMRLNKSLIPGEVFFQEGSDLVKGFILLRADIGTKGNTSR